MMHYFIDGYNFIFTLTQEKHSLEKERELLIAALMAFPLNMTLVFDGGSEQLPQRSHKKHLEIVFTGKNQTADTYIRDEIFRKKNPSLCTVVTSDKNLAAICCHMNASSLSIKAFLAKLKKKKSHSSIDKPARETDKNLQRLHTIFTDLLNQSS